MVPKLIGLLIVVVVPASVYGKRVLLPFVLWLLLASSADCLCCSSGIIAVARSQSFLRYTSTYILTTSRIHSSSGAEVVAEEESLLIWPRVASYPLRCKVSLLFVTFSVQMQCVCAWHVSGVFLSLPRNHHERYLLLVQVASAGERAD